MEKNKVINYTADQTAALVSGYQAGQSVEALALQVGKGIRSVIAKLVKENVYVAKAKAHADHVTKAQLISTIAAKTGASEEALESLEKANKDALVLLANAL